MLLKNVRVPGLEPGTSVLSGLRSNQLSYTREIYPAIAGMHEIVTKIAPQ